MAYDINYPKMIDDALHGVVRDVLGLVSKEGLRDGHHFFISFLTQAVGVELSSPVKEKYPQEITIVVQYQFKNLEVFKDHFSIFLSFDGVEEKVVVPYRSITAFSDPHDKISLQFNYYQETLDTNPKPEERELGIVEEEAFISQDAAPTSNVIPLDKFRQNTDR